MNWYKKSQKLKEVSLKGTLKQTPTGFIYLDIPDDVMNGLFAIIDEDDISKPPYHLKSFNSVGAHASVFKEDEVEEKELNVKEVGKEFNFSLGDFKSTNPDGWDEVEEVYFVQIKSKELEDLRKKYDLPAKIDGHEFHITIAIEKA